MSTNNAGTIEFAHPSPMLVAGPTGSGKSHFVVRLLDEHMYDKPFDKIYWYYREWQPLFSEIQRRHPIIFNQHLPNSFDHLNANENNLVIIDDLMTDSSSSEHVLNLFTVGSHHRNATVVLISQNLFDQGKASRGISLNSHYIVLMKNPRDKTQVRSFGMQFMPNRVRFLSDAYEDATSDAYTYLLIDCRPETPDDFRVRTSIFRTDPATIVYKPTAK